HLLRRGRVDLVDHHHIGHADVGLARVVAGLMAGTVWIDDGDGEIRTVKGEVVVAAVPNEDVRLGLGLLQDLAVVDSRVDDVGPVDVGRVRLARSDGAAVCLEIAVSGEALHRLVFEVAVGRGVPHDQYFETRRGENLRDLAGRLALAGSRL